MKAVNRVDPVKNSFRIAPTVGVSLLLHLALIGGVSLSYTPVAIKAPAPSTIKARLVIAPPPAKIAPLAPAPDIVQEVAPEEPPPAPPEQGIPKQEKIIKPQAQAAAPTSTKPGPISVPANNLSVSPRAALNNYMQRQQDKQRTGIAAQAAREFRQQKDSPVIVDPRAGVEVEPVSRPVNRINCQSSVNKAVGIVSALVGGTLKCTDPTKDLELYINNRTGKTGEN